MKQYLTVVCDPIVKDDMINEFVGAEVVACSGAPLDDPLHTSHAPSAARDIDRFALLCGGPRHSEPLPDATIPRLSCARLTGRVWDDQVSR
jgi:hypothetical protein